jgi:ApbE superfamily uncharacterized protein (UPF0280 family)
MYEPRLYRIRSTDGDLVSFTVVVRETDLYIRAKRGPTKRDLTEKARQSVTAERALLEGYIRQHPGFAVALEPFPVDDEAPDIVKDMAAAADRAGVGPMAAVAGAIAERVGNALAGSTPEVIVENGGDIFLKLRRKRLVGIHAGAAAFRDRLALEIRPEETPLGVSSGTVGHSLSLGSADAAIVLAPSTALADAAATAIGNVVRGQEDVQKGIRLAQEIDGLSGAAVIKDEALAVWGQVRLVKV